MGYKNIRLPDVMHATLKKLSLDRGESITETLEVVTRLGMGALIYQDSEGKPIDLVNEPNMLYAETGMEIPRKSNERYMEYLNRCRLEEGDLYTE